ncbi:hypothetical protein B0H14DRAFT_3467119 [Mycena olivaceomarginata]|nr:hypothetical protein B0H14DRAFT_3467119 [Mycena olivaceomarginata]
MKEMRECWYHLPSVDLWDRVQLYRDICSTPVADGWLESCSPNWELVKEILVQAQAERSHLRHVNEQAFRRRKSTYSPKVKDGKPGQSAGIKTKTTALGTSSQRRQAKEHVLYYDDKPGQSAGIKMKTSGLGTSSQRRQPKEHVLPYDDIVQVANAPSCPRCDTKPEMERCVRRIPVKRRPQSDLEFWRGSMLTCADSSDVMAGQVKRQVFSPNELQLKEIAPQTKEELGDCGQDIALFQEEGTGHLIGGVQFDAWDRETLAGLRKKSYDSGRGVRALFAAAKDSDTLLETVRSFAPQVVHEVQAKTQVAGINRMGRMGMNSFYCWEYASPLHVDDDEGWSICCQLYKNCRSDEYNFAYIEWGIYIRTEANCIWFFNPNHLHGTVLPRQSSLASAVSRGTHTTIRRKDIEKASLFDEERPDHVKPRHGRHNIWTVEDGRLNGIHVNAPSKNQAIQNTPLARTRVFPCIALALDHLAETCRERHTHCHQRNAERTRLLTSWEDDRRPGSSCSSDSGLGLGLWLGLRLGLRLTHWLSLVGLARSDSDSDSLNPFRSGLSPSIGPGPATPRDSLRSDSDSDSLNPFRSGLSLSIGPSPATPRDSQPTMQRRELLRKPALIEMEDLPSQLAHDGHASVRNLQEGAIVLVAFTNAIAFTRGTSPSPRAIVSMSVHRKSDGERQDEMEDPNHLEDRVSYPFQKLGLFLLELDYRLCTPFLVGPAVHPKLKSSCSLAVIGMAPQRNASHPELEAVVARRPEQLQLLVWDAPRRYSVNLTLTARRELDEARAKAFDSFQLFHESAVNDSWALDPQQLAEERELRHKNLTDALARNRREPTPANLQALEEARRCLLAVSYRGDKAEGEDSDGYSDVDSIQDEIEAPLKAARPEQCVFAPA